MHYYIGKYDESLFAVPETFAGHCTGYERVTLVGRNVGSVHTEACISRLQPGGSIGSCVHAYEKVFMCSKARLKYCVAGSLSVCRPKVLR